MGTSTTSRGPKGKTSLLPTYYVTGDGSSNQDGNTNSTVDGTGNNLLTGNNQQPVNNQDAAQQGKATVIPKTTNDWSDARNAFTRYTNKTRGSNIRKAANSYVKTYGGSGGATRSASRGISAGQKLVSFLGAMSAPVGSGYEETLKGLGLSAYVGKRPEEALAKIADAIAPTGATNDDAIARDAIISTLDRLYTRITEQGGDITALETLTPEMIKETVIEYVSTYIFDKWVYELGLAVEKNAVSEQQAINIEADMKEFIRAEVNLSLKDKAIDDFNLHTSANKLVIDNIFQTAYSTLEK